MNNIDDRSWTDQPKELIGNPKLCTFELDLIRKDDEGEDDEYKVQVEVRSAVRGFYLTFGTLFNSQTLHAEDAHAAFRAIHYAVKSDKAPPGCKILRNDGSKA